MAVFTEETSLYEILIRVNPDKTWAAQYQLLTEVKKDGSVIGSSVSDVAPLTENNQEAYAVVVSLMGEIAANTLQENLDLKDMLTHALQEIENLKAQSSASQ